MPELTSRRKKKQRPSEELDQKFRRILTNISNDAEAVQKQSFQAAEDMRFLNATGGMWPDNSEALLEDRVMLQFPLAADYVNRHMGEWNTNRMGVIFRPGDDAGTTEKDARLLNGIYRNDFRERGSGKKAVDNAVLEVFHCGYGAYKISEQWVDKGDKKNKLKQIKFSAVINAYQSLFWDNASQEIDKADARRCVRLKRFTDESFREQYPDEIPSSAYTPDATTFRIYSSDSLNSTTAPIFVAEYYEKIEKSEIIFEYHDIGNEESVFFTSEEHEKQKRFLKKNENMVFIEERRIVVDQIEKSVLSGLKFLEEPRIITGDVIPFVTLYGYRGYENGNEWYKGLIRDLKDFSKQFNTLMSKLAEISSTTASDLPVLSPEQTQGTDALEVLEDPTNATHLSLNSLKDAKGNALPPKIEYLKSPQIDGGTAALIPLLLEVFTRMTGGSPKEITDRNLSGRAIREMRKIQDMNVQPVMENIATGIEWGGEIYKGKAAVLYTMSRMIRTIAEDGTESLVQLEKFEQSEETGDPVLTNSIRGKKFKVYSDTGPQFATLRQEATETTLKTIELLAQIPAAQPFMLPLLGSLMENQEGPGMERVGKLARKLMLLQGLEEPDTDEEKQMVALAQQNQKDPQAEFLDGERKKAEAEARKDDADVALKKSQTLKNLSDINVNRNKINVEERLNIFKVFSDIEKQRFQQREQENAGNNQRLN